MHIGTLNARWKNVFAQFLGPRNKRKGIRKPPIVSNWWFIKTMRIPCNLAPCSAELSCGVLINRSNGKNFENNSRQAQSSGSWAQSVLFWLRTSLHGQNERATLTGMSRADLYFGMLVPLNAPEHGPLPYMASHLFSQLTCISGYAVVKYVLRHTRGPWVLLFCWA